MVEEEKEKTRELKKTHEISDKKLRADIGENELVEAFDQDNLNEKIKEKTKKAREKARELDHLLKQNKEEDTSMDSNYFEKYIEAKFDGIDQKITHIDENIKEMRTDIKEMRAEYLSEYREMNKKFDSFKVWILGTGITILISLGALFYEVIGYHASAMQSQMEVFSKYVEAVTQQAKPQTPKTP